MFEAIKRDVFVRALYITRGKFKGKTETRKTAHAKSRTSGAITAHGSRGVEVPSVREPVGARGPARPRGPRGLGGASSSSEPSPTPPAIRLQPAAEYDNVSIFHLPDITINKAMIQKGLC